MTKHIGIVACSYEGAALCYQTICREGASDMGEHAHPEITLIVLQEDSSLPVLDSTSILARASFKYSLGNSPAA
jgi:hypothetical protein